MQIICWSASGEDKLLLVVEGGRQVVGMSRVVDEEDRK